MNHGKYVLGMMLVFFIVEIPSLFGEDEDDAGSSGFVTALLNNAHYLESVRLTKLAEECYNGGEYDDAVRYAEEAIKYALWSDSYVSLQLKIKNANDAIASAEKRLAWAVEVDAPKRYVQEYEDAGTAYEEALDARSGEAWDEAMEAALRVIEFLSGVTEGTILAAQYLVKTWNPLKDCLWNIAAKPQIYGDPSKWTFIYNANKDKFSKPNNPNLIHPGMILDIPSINGEIRAGVWWEEDDSILQ
jgi:tetratricopeptide (TPR) repeat protein